MLNVSIRRDVMAGSYPFTELFKGFEAVETIRSLFGEKTERILAEIRVDVQGRPGYLRVDDETGNIVVSGEYLRTGKERSLYLDVIHELVHVRQFMEGKELFDGRFNYVDRPTEIEAYRTGVIEGRKIGMNDDDLTEYFRVEWLTEEDFGRLLVNVEMKPNEDRASPANSVKKKKERKE
jgi:hypothetical protein